MKKLIVIICVLIVTSSLYAQENGDQKQDYFPKGSLSLRTNIIPWLTLMPNIGLEYKTSDNIGLIIDGGWAHWNLDTQNKYWRMWNVSPQIRYYIGEAKYNYIGTQCMIGQYNLVGRQGKYMGGALTLGHQFHAGKNLMVDIGISLGYLYLYDKERYERIDNSTDYRNGQKTSNGYWGPTGASISFVWIIN